MDVRSLHTNIPATVEISAVKRAFDNYPKKTTTTTVITTFLALILSLNDFRFDCIPYLQIKGRKLGTICAPTYANIFMADFEFKYTCPYIKDKTKMLLSFIDQVRNKNC